MGRILLLLLSPLLLLSCSNYRYITVNSTELDKGPGQEFVMENDSFRLTYHFNGHSGPMRISLLNKTNAPVYIDWNMSSMIVNAQATAYASSVLTFAGSYKSEQTPQPVINGTTTSGDFSGHVKAPWNREFIPPGTYIQKTLGNLSNWLSLNIHESAFSPTRLAMPNGGSVRGYYVAYTAEQSPVRFRSYLTLVTADAVPRTIILEHNFYIAEILRTMSSPNNYSVLHGGPRGDVYYLSSLSGGGAALAAVGLMGAFILAAQAAGPTENPE